MYSFGAKSELNLDRVHPLLCALARTALHLSAQDFGIMCGVRSYEDQAKAVAAGNSKTMESKHLIQPDGYGHAIDAVPWVNGAFSWDWEACYRVAAAFTQAADRMNCADKIRWGGVWDYPLKALIIHPLGFKGACVAYCQRHPGKDFLDGPHFEITGARI